MTRQECAAIVVGGPTHFSEERANLARAFDDAGLAALRLRDHGTWIPFRPTEMPG